MNFKDRLKELREENGISLTELSGLTGISRPTLSRYESGDRKPKIEQLEKLANYFDVELEYLTGEKEFSAKRSGRLALGYLEKFNNDFHNREYGEAEKDLSELEDVLPQASLKAMLYVAEALQDTEKSDISSKDKILLERLNSIIIENLKLPNHLNYNQIADETEEQFNALSVFNILDETKFKDISDKIETVLFVKMILAFENKAIDLPIDERDDKIELAETALGQIITMTSDEVKEALNRD